MWLPIFVVGFAYVLYKAVREPVWAAAGGVYLYFAIPHVEFKAPPAPYQAAFFGLAILGAFRYYGLYKQWGATEIHEHAQDIARKALDVIRQPMADALAQAGLGNKLPGEIQREAYAATEAVAVAFVEKECPAAINIAVRRAVQTAVAAAAAAGEAEVLKIAETAGKSTRGNFKVTLEERVPAVVSAALDNAIGPAVKENVDLRLAEDNKITNHGQGRGPLGIPLPNGPLAGVFTNVGFYLHLIFIGLTYYGVQNSVFDPSRGASRIPVTYLLLIPLSAILLAVRNAQQFRIYVFAWMFGTFHLAMNGVTYWLQYGGRADNAGGQGGEANYLGAVIVTIAPVAFGLAVNLKNLVPRMISLGFAGIYALGVLASGSRAGLLALIGAMGYWLMFTHRRGIAIGLFFMAAAGFGIAAPSDFWQKMATIVERGDSNPWIEYSIEPSKHERLVLWGLAKKLYAQYPITGVGPMNYPVISAEETTFTDPYQGQRGLQAHNTWLQLLAEYGTIGGLVWGGAFLFSTFCYARARSRMKRYPGYEWFPALCLGLEAGSIASAIVLSFNSFMWYDYVYWHMVSGPLAWEIAKKTSERLEWLKPGQFTEARPPARYGPPKKQGLDLSSVDLSQAAPLSKEGRTGQRV